MVIVFLLFGEGYSQTAVQSGDTLRIRQQQETEWSAESPGWIEAGSGCKGKCTRSGQWKRATESSQAGQGKPSRHEQGKGRKTSDDSQTVGCSKRRGKARRSRP